MFNLMYIFFGMLLLINGILCIILKNKKINLIINIFLLFFFVMLIGIRPLLIPDTKSYFDFYKNIDSNLLNLEYSYYEKGFVLFSKIIKKYISNSEKIYFSVISIFNLFLLERNLKKEYKKVVIPIYIYIYIILWNIS